VPVLVMQGYTVLLREALEQLNTRPTHLLVQAGGGGGGGGGLAAAVSTHLSCVWGEERPTLVIVEPRRAACLYESAAAIADALRRLTYPLQGDPAIVARGSGGAGLADLMTLTDNPDARGALGPGAVATCENVACCYESFRACIKREPVRHFGRCAVTRLFGRSLRSALPDSSKTDSVVCILTIWLSQS